MILSFDLFVVFTQWLREFGQNDAQCNESDQYKEYEPCDEH